MLLLLLQAAQQAASPVHIVVDRAPSGRMPEWVKILISAGVGTVLGIISGISMEYLKPWIARLRSNKNVRKDLDMELLQALTAVDAAYKYMADAEGGSDIDKRRAMNVALFAVTSITNDRFKDNFESNKAVVYELDPHRQLFSFYGLLKNNVLAAIESQNFGSAKAHLELAITIAGAYMNENGLKYQRNQTQWTAFEELHKGIKPNLLFEIEK